MKKEQAVAVKQLYGLSSGFGSANGGIGKMHRGILLARGFTPKLDGCLCFIMVLAGQPLLPNPLPGKAFWTVPDQDGQKSGGGRGI